ncbi:MAG: hypothetical protein Kow00117_07900 [Phototrophicales bacterium]
MFKQPLSEEERAQVRFLLRSLAIIVLFVILAAFLVGTIASNL